MIVYRCFRALGRIALRWYYREIEVLGTHHIPVHGPVLVASNHPNALVDALVISCSLRRPVTLTAKATLLDRPVTRLLLRSVGVVPLQRASDARGTQERPAPLDPARNARAFSAVLDTLERGGVVLLFPEGRSHSEPALVPLKTGLARMALMARDERHLQDVRIIPIGLMFEQKWAPRTRVVMQIGAAITMRDVPDSNDGVVMLTQRIDTGLRQVTLNFRSAEEGRRIMQLAMVLAGVLDHFRPLHHPDPPLAHAVQLARRIFDIVQRAPQLSPAVARRIAHFTDRFDTFDRMLESSHIPASDVQMSTALAPAAWFVVRELTIAMVAGPLAMWGRVNHWIPLRLARMLGERSSRTPDEPAMRTIVLGLILVLSFYTVQTMIVAQLFGWLAGALYLASLPPSATWHIRYTDRLRRAAVRIRVFWRFRQRPAFRQELLGEAAWIRDEAHAIASTVAESGRAIASAGHASDPI